MSNKNHYLGQSHLYPDPGNFRKVLLKNPNANPATKSHDEMTPEERAESLKKFENLCRTISAAWSSVDPYWYNQTIW